MCVRCGLTRGVSGVLSVLLDIGRGRGKVGFASFSWAGFKHGPGVSSKRNAARAERGRSPVAAGGSFRGRGVFSSGDVGVGAQVQGNVRGAMQPRWNPLQKPANAVAAVYDRRVFQAFRVHAALMRRSQSAATGLLQKVPLGLRRFMVRPTQG